LVSSQERRNVKILEEESSLGRSYLRLQWWTSLVSSASCSRQFSIRALIAPEELLLHLVFRPLLRLSRILFGALERKVRFFQTILRKI